MPTPEGVLLKIDRAKQHFRDLEGHVGPWIEANPYAYIRETDPESGDQLLRFKPKGEVPVEAWSPTIGDVVHNLRSALDHLVCALVVVNGKRVYGGNEFPVADSPQRYKARAIGCVQGVGKRPAKLIHSLKPYKGGNDLLWVLHMLDINDKHRGLVVAVSSQESVIIDFSKMMQGLPLTEGMPAMPIAIRPAHRCPVEDGDVLYRIPKAMIGKGDDHPQIPFAPAFYEPGIIECEPVGPVLVQLINEVDRVVELFDGFFPNGMPIHRPKRPPGAPAPEALAMETIASGYSDVPASKYSFDPSTGKVEPILDTEGDQSTDEVGRHDAEASQPPQEGEAQMTNGPERDPLKISGECENCRHPYSVQVPGIEGPADMPPPGASVDRKFSHWCEQCGHKLDFEVSVRNVDGAMLASVITGPHDPPLPNQ